MWLISRCQARKKLMRSRIPMSFGLAVVGATWVVVGATVEAESGREAYLRYCANCHGVEGRGDGVDAARFARPPRNLRDGFLDAYGIDDLVDRILSGKRLSLAVDPAKWAELETKTGEVLEHLRRLARVRWLQVAQGWALYLSRCVDCHGPYGQPPMVLPSGVRRPRDLQEGSWQRSVTDATLLVAVRHGRAGMPALVPQIREDEGRALVAFVRLMSPGFELYQRACAVCHGDDGRGVQPTAGEVARLPSVRFDRAYFAKRSETEIRAAIRHMLREHEPAMPHFAAVTDRATVRAIVEYLKRGLP